MVFTFRPRHIAIPVFALIAFIVIISIAVIMLAFCSGVFAFVFVTVFARETVTGEVEVFPFFNLWWGKSVFSDAQSGLGNIPMNYEKCRVISLHEKKRTHFFNDRP